MKHIDDILRRIEEKRINVFSVTVVTGGQSETVILQENELHQSVPVCRNVYSVSKAYTMVAVGFLFDEGKISPDTSIAEVFGALPAGSDPKWADVTVDHLLRHKTGYLRHEDPIQAYDMDVSNLNDYTGGDWLSFILSRPITGVPGEEGSYTDTGFYILSRMVAQISGESMQDYLRRKLFTPTGFRNWAWFMCPLGHAFGGTGLIASTEDMVKLGQLFLQRGLWQDQRLLSEEWIDLALAREYAFSRLKEGLNAYGKGGMFGQELVFSYDHDCAIAIESYTAEDLCLGDLLAGQ